MLRRFVLSGLGFLGYMSRTVPPPVHVPPRCTVPDFVNYIEENGYDKFNPRMPVFIGYATFTAWIRDNSLETVDNVLLDLAEGTLEYPEYSGNADTRANTRAVIERLVGAMTRRMTGVAEAPTRTITMIRKLLASAHPDRYNNKGLRTRYASCALTAVLNRCQAVYTADASTEASEIMGLLPMPHILITPFNGYGSRTNPPSQYEYTATKYFHDRDETSSNYAKLWNDIQKYATRGDVLAAEKRFWVSYAISNEQIHFAEIP